MEPDHRKLVSEWRRIWMTSLEPVRAASRWWFRDPDWIRVGLSGERPDEAGTIRGLPQRSRHKLMKPGTKAVVVATGKKARRCGGGRG